MVRLFFGLELPEELRRRIAALQAGIDRARFVAPEDLHVTLRFIGEVDRRALRDLADAARTVRFAPLEVTLAGAGHFESRGRVNAVWLGVAPDPALAALRDRLEAALAGAGLVEAERRRFRPHVTVARLTRGRPGEVRRWLAANALFRAAPFAVRRFVLFSSAPRAAPPRYCVEGAFPDPG